MHCISSLENELKNKKREMEELKSQKEAEFAKMKGEKEAEIDELKIKYEVFVQNTANNICCKAKVDNPDIQYYKVENNKIVCLEEGELGISC